MIIMIFISLVVPLALLSSDTQDHAAIGGKVVSFIKKSIREGVKVHDIEVVKLKPLEDGWYSVVVSIDIEGAPKRVEEVFLTNGKYITNRMFNIDDMRNYNAIARARCNETHDVSLYDPKNLIYGSETSAKKVVVFSDPLCPVCVEFMAELSERLTGDQDMAVYYYPIPLKSLHPYSEKLVGLVEKYKKQKQNNKADWQLYKALNDNKALYRLAMQGKMDAVMKQVFDVDQEELSGIRSDDRSIHNEAAAKRLNVSATPTVYVNGELDYDRSKIFDKR